MIFDTHCHLGFGEQDPDAVHGRARAAGVRWMLDVGIDEPSSRQALERAARLPGVLASVGLHPNEAAGFDRVWPRLQALCRQPRCAAIGETGMDLYWDRAAPEDQERAFRAHLALATTLDKPVVIHCRNAFGPTFAVLREHAGLRGVMHCFSGGLDEARTALDLGLHLSFAGPLTYPRAAELRRAAAFAPGDHILVETDAPFLPPQGRRGLQNEPAWVVAVVEKLAEVRGITREEAAALTARNARDMFGVAADGDEDQRPAPAP